MNNFAQEVAKNAELCGILARGVEAGSIVDGAELRMLQINLMNLASVMSNAGLLDRIRATKAAV